MVSDFAAHLPLILFHKNGCLRERAAKGVHERGLKRLQTAWRNGTREIILMELKKKATTSPQACSRWVTRKRWRKGRISARSSKEGTATGLLDKNDLWHLKGLPVLHITLLLKTMRPISLISMHGLINVLANMEAMKL